MANPSRAHTLRGADGYELAQILAWIAARRSNVAQRLEWRAQIQPLMSWLVPTRS